MKSAKNLVVSAIAACMAVNADPVDGFQWGPAWYSPYDAFCPQYWENGVVAADGGVAYFTGTQSPTLKFGSAYTLGGIDFGNVKFGNSCPAIPGGKLTMAGDAFIKGTGRGTAGSGSDQFAAVNSTVSGTGANTLTINGPGMLRIDVAAPFVNFGTVASAGGGLYTGLSGALFTTSEHFAIRGGVVNWTPSATGATAATLPAVTYGDGAGMLRVSKGGASSATLTLASLGRETDGAALEIAAAGGMATLGDTEKVMVSEAPAAVNGILDPGLVVRDRSQESWPVFFTKYDAAKGIVPFTDYVPFADAGATDVARLAETNTLTESKQVAALVVDNSAKLEIAADVTLKVGDDNPAHRAGVIFNRQILQANNDEYPFSGEGTLDFGASPGVIWSSSPSKGGSWGGNRRLGILTRITGSAGVTFAARWREASQATGIFDLYGGYANWTGPTRVAGAMLWVMNNGALPPGDIHVEQGENYAAGQLRLGSANGTLSQNLFLSGYGPLGDGDGVLWVVNGTHTFNGVVTLTGGDVWISSENENASTFVFKNEIRGPGSLIIDKGGEFNLTHANTFDKLVLQKNTTVNVITNGTLGAGRVWQKGNATFNYRFRGVNGLVVTNEFRQTTGTANGFFEYANMALDTDVKFANTTLGNFSKVKIGGKVDLGNLKAAGARDTTAGDYGRDEVSASRAGAELLLGTGNDGTFALPVSDGAGTLSLVKKGAGTLELPPVERTYSGATRIEAGTLRLNDDPLLAQSLLYRLDASREEDFTKDDAGNVTEWRPCGGTSGIKFSKTSGTVAWSSENGTNAVTTTGAKLTGNMKLEHRTVIIVCRLNEAKQFAGVFGAKSSEINDYGQRINSGSDGYGNTAQWDSTLSHFNFNTTKRVRHDGVQHSAQANLGKTQILTFIHDRDNWPPAVSWGAPTYTATFTPELGGYAGAARAFNGDYFEVLAFDRVLSEIEIRKVEQYLARKWLNTSLWADADLVSPAVLPAATALHVAEGSTFDLNGVSVTVASLSGTGAIVNSSDKPATLTVTGANTFSGRIASGAKVSAASTGSVAVDAGGTLAVSGTATLGEHSLLPPTDGLAYWCDAGRPETILTNASGSVTSWVSRAESSASALVNSGTMPNTTSTKSKPVFNSSCATAMQGRPGVFFATGTEALWANVSSPVRSVFVVAMLPQNQSNCNGLWGPTGRDCGFRFGSGTTTLEGSTSVVRPTASTDRVRLNGGTTYSFGLNAVGVFSARFGSTDPVFYATIGLESPTPTRATTIGNYCGNPSLVGYVGEVIAYNRVLSDAEMTAVEEYLTAKWKTNAWTDGKPPAESVQGLVGNVEIASGANVTAANGTMVGTLSGGGAIVGNVSANGFLVNVKPDGTTDTLTVNGVLTLVPGATLTVTGADYLKAGVNDVFLRATGITGGFADSNLDRPNGYHVTSTTASVFHSAGMFLILR